MGTPRKTMWPEGLAIRSMMHALDFLPHGHFIVEFTDDTQIEFDNFGEFASFIMQRERATTRLAALEADARRYRWLRGENEKSDALAKSIVLFKKWHENMSLDKEIDAALSQEPAEGG